MVATVHNLTVDTDHTYTVATAAGTDVVTHNDDKRRAMGDAQELACRRPAPADIPWSSGQVSRAAKDIQGGGTAIHVANRSQAEELFLGIFQGQGYRNATGMDGPRTRDFFGSKQGIYHWDDQLDAEGRVMGHGAGNADGALPHLQVQTFEGPIVRIFWGG